jgi:glycosyltransferase involved in cell wall biosynthesis
VHTFHGHVFEGYFPPLASLAITFAERVLARVGDAVVALSPSQAEELAERWHIGRAPLPVVPMGIELGPLLSADAERGALRRELAVPGGVPVIAFVGRLIAIKGLSTLLQSLAGLRREGIAFRLVVAGDGDRRASLEREARGAGLGSWAHFLGWRRDLPRLYADADVVALPSRREGVPVSVMEAMAAGRPVVAAHVGGVPDLVEDGRTGCLVPPGDPIALARAVRDLLADPARRRAMGDAARATARERFDVERSAGALDAFYRGLLARPRRLRQ